MVVYQLKGWWFNPCFLGQDIEAKDAPGMSVSACMKVRKHFDKETVLVLIRVCVCK